MKFQLNIEIDEKEARLTQKEAIDYVIDSLSESLVKTGAYFDIGCSLGSVVSGLTN